MQFKNYLFRKTAVHESEYSKNWMKLLLCFCFLLKCVKMCQPNFLSAKMGELQNSNVWINVKTSETQKHIQIVTRHSLHYKGLFLFCLYCCCEFLFFKFLYFDRIINNKSDCLVVHSETIDLCCAEWTISVTSVHSFLNGPPKQSLIGRGQRDFFVTLCDPPL